MTVSLYEEEKQHRCRHTEKMLCEDRGTDRSDRAANQGPQGLGHPLEAGGCEEDRSLEHLEEHSPAGSLITDLKPPEM